MTVLAVLLRCNLLQVKPQYLDTILEALKPHILPSHLVISIAAGIRVASLEAALPEGTRVASASIPYCNATAWIATWCSLACKLQSMKSH